MTNKEFKKLSRSELLEMLLEQSKEVEQLKKQLKAANEALESKNIMLKNTGSIAEASLKLTNIFEEAQKAADIYLENIKNLEYEKQKKMELIIQEEYKKYGIK